MGAIYLTPEMIREIAAEHRFIEVKTTSEGLISFVRKVANGQIKVNFWEQSQLILLQITKEQIGFKNFNKAFPCYEYEIVYRIFHNPNSFRK